MTRDERGQVTAFLAVFVVALVVVGGLVIDGGSLLAAKRRAISEAEGAARAGAQALAPGALRRGAALPDPTGAAAAADAYLAKTGHQGVVAVEGDTVRVTVSFHQPMLVLGIGGLASVAVTGEGAARAAQGPEEQTP
ncbi:MAG: pilus assembly protein TadG-related protein [Actinomycetota bacterium]